MSIGDSGSVLITGAAEAAKFIAQLVREGVTFKAEQTVVDTYRITLTGGY